MAIALPTKPKAKTRTGFPYQSVWLVGSPPKVGKSKMIEGLWQTTKRAGKELKVLHIDMENSCEDIGGYVLRCTNLSEVREAIAALRADPSKFQGVCFDTIDVVNAWAEEETINELKGTSTEKAGSLADLQVMGDDRVGFGKDWAMARKKVANIIQSAQMAGLMVFLLAHTKVERGSFSGVNIALPQGLGIKVRGLCQVIGYVYCSEEGGRVVRYITFRSADSTVAGSRYSELNDANVRLRLRDRKKDGKGYVDWSPIFQLFGENPDGTPYQIPPTSTS